AIACKAGNEGRLVGLGQRFVQVVGATDLERSGVEVLKPDHAEIMPGLPVLALALEQVLDVMVTRVQAGVCLLHTGLGKSCGAISGKKRPAPLRKLVEAYPTGSVRAFFRSPGRGVQRLVQGSLARFARLAEAADAITPAAIPFCMFVWQALALQPPAAATGRQLQHHVVIGFLQRCQAGAALMLEDGDQIS